MAPHKHIVDDTHSDIRRMACVIVYVYGYLPLL